MLLAYVAVDGHLAQYITGDVMRFTLYLILALSLATCYAKWAIARWQRPSRVVVYRNHVTHFRNTPYPESLEANKTRPALPALNSKGRLAGETEEKWDEELVER